MQFGFIKTLLSMMLLSLISTAIAKEQSIRVSFLNPGKNTLPEGQFWLAVSEFMIAAAEDLSIELDIHYAQRNVYKMVVDAKKILGSANPPDYLVIVNEKEVADTLIKLTEKSNTKALIILNDFLGEQAMLMGEPRANYKSWIGSIVPDNQQAGRLMADALYRNIERRSGDDKQIHFIGIGGDETTPASIERNQGLVDFIANNQNISLQQMVFGHWERNTTRKKVQNVLKRHKQIDAFWVANDSMAAATIESIEKTNRVIGKDIFIVGCNALQTGLQLVQSGKLVATVGGHFMTGGWGLVLIHDYHHGVDFSHEQLRFKYQLFYALDQHNIDDYLNRFAGNQWSKINFRNFSKHLNPKLKKYNFGLDAINKSLE